MLRRACTTPGAVLGLATALAAVGCGPSAIEPLPPAPPIAGSAPERERAPATSWHYHPRQVGQVADGLRLEDGSWLLVSDLGERWHSEPLPAAPPAHPVRVFASIHRAPEGLARIVRPSSSRWLFVGESGTPYRSASAMGALTPAPVPPRAVFELTGSEQGIVGLGALGGLLRFDGKSWIDAARDCVDVKGKCLRLFDVERTAGGALLGLAIPEALVASDDGGASWSRLQAPEIGAHRLTRSRSGGVLVEGAASALHFDGAALGPPTSEQRSVELPSAEGTLLPARGPRAVAIEERHACFDGARYLEVFDDPDGSYGSGDGPGRWMLARGQVGAPLDVKPLPVPAACEGFRIAASGRHVVLLCLGEQHNGTRVRVFRSSDGGDHFVEQLELRAPDDDIDVAVGPGGHALITGVCPSGGGDCKPRAPLSLGARGPVRHAHALDLTDRATAPAFSADGRAAYFFGRRGKDEQIALYVSRDGGASFRARSLEPPRGRSWDTAGDLVRSIHPGGDGELGLLLEPSPPIYAVADADGTIASVAKLPPGVLSVSGHGRRVMAIGSETLEGSPALVVVWESNDGGLSFRRTPLPMRLEVDEFQEPLAVRCGPAACVIGSRLTRLGSGEDHANATPGGGVRPEDAASRPAVRTAIACTPEAGGWETLTDVEPPVLPDARVAMRGPSAWAALRSTARGELSAVSAPLDGGKLRRHVLFSAVDARARWAYHVAPQMEGYVAARARIPADRRAIEGAPLALELAWIDYVGDRSGRARLDAGQLAQRDVTPGASPHLLLELMSVSPGGLIVRPHAERPDTFVLDAEGRLLQQVDYPAWPAIPAETRIDDATLVDGVPIAVAVHARGHHSETLATLSPFGSTTTRFATLAPEPAAQRAVTTRWSSGGGEVGIAVEVLDLAGPRGYAAFRAFTKDGGLGPPLPLPTQLDLPADAPRPCSDADRSGSPRLLAHHAAGTRHPVLVGTSHVLLSGDAVLYGSPAAPCVAAWHAVSLRGSAERTVAIVRGDLSHGWLFRETPAKDRALDVQRLTCRWAPGAELPEALWREPGTLAP